MASINYYINGINLREYGVYVESASGLLSIPERKEMVSHSYDNEHGISVDVGSLYVKERTITLKCFTRIKNNSDFFLDYSSFINAISVQGIIRMTVEIAGANPLVYNLYYAPKTDITPKYNCSKMMATFDLTFKEPQPVKRVYAVTSTSSGQTVTLNLTGTALNRYYTAYWGDGSVSRNVSQAATVTHTFVNAGTYYIVICGDIQQLQSSLTFSSNINGSLIWNILW